MLKLTRSIFNGNLTPKGNGGALFNASGAQAEIGQSSFNGNLAGTPPSTNRQGGAINNLNGKLAISASVLLNNGVTGDGGAIANDRGGSLIVANTVLAGLNAGDFSFGAGVSLTLADGQAPVAIALSCTPTAPGIRTATLTLSTNDPTRPTVTFNLTCKGVTPPAPVLAAPGASISNALADGNSGPYGLAISPDGKHVYTADDGDSMVTVFGRNQTGNLFF